MKKLIFAILLLLTATTTMVVVNADTVATKLIVHYFRYEGDYTGWDAWIWDEKGATDEDTLDILFDQTDAWGAYFELDLDATTGYDNATQVGIILRKGSWDIREFSYDRYIDLTTADVNAQGEIHAYLVQGDEQIGTTDADLLNNIPDKRNRILYAGFNDNLDVTVSLTTPATSYVVNESGNQVISSSSANKDFTISMSGVDIAKTYTITAVFADVTRTITISKEKVYDTDAFQNAYTYTGELGVIYSKQSTTFRLWAPLSDNVAVNIYEYNNAHYDNDGTYRATADLPLSTTNLTQIENGAWEITLNGDFAGKYYTFDVTNDGATNEVVDPYAYSTGVNGERGMIVDFDATDPINWVENYRPNTILNMTDYTVYELHVRDLTTHSSWDGNDAYRGKFLGLSESGTTYTEGDVTVTTGLDHIDELGVNAVQLLPIFDFGYVDETRVDDPNYDAFNWGYMPINFNTLEGSYSTNPYDGYSRITEFKTAVQAFHDDDIRVIMDVVYNHTGLSGDSNFNLILPGYYHRMNSDGSFSNGSGTGNETASERPMMRKLMVDSTTFLATEYNLSGFRFDLMALHDVQTMDAIRAAMNEIDPTIVLYGEPWTGGTSPLASNLAAGRDNIQNLDGVGTFSDTTRNGIKGSVFQAAEGGWIQAQSTTDISYLKSEVEYGISGGTSWSQGTAWHLDPNKIVNYVSAHDNHTLYDKLKLSGISRTQIPYLQQQANAIVLTSQGIPFLHAGVEIMRTKQNDDNSYQSGDAINQLDWSRKIDYLNVFNYYKGMIELRSIYENFRMGSADEIAANLTFYQTDDYTIAFKITGQRATVIVISVSYAPEGFSSVELGDTQTYHVLSTHDNVDLTGFDKITSGTAYVPSNTTMVLTNTVLTEPININPEPEQSNNIWLFIGIGAVAVAAAAVVSVIILKKKSA